MTKSWDQVKEEMRARDLLSRLEELQDIALTASPGPWRYGHDVPRMELEFHQEEYVLGSWDQFVIAGTGERGDAQSIRDAKFIATNDPASVLEDIATKREIVYTYASLYYMRERFTDPLLHAHYTMLEGIVYELAFRFNDHDDWNDGW